MELNKTDAIDRRLVVNFPSLSEEQEKLILDHLMEFIIYYSTVVNIEKQNNAATMFDYYCRNIMKPESVEILIEDVNVVIDAIRFIEQYYNPLVMIIRKNNLMIIDISKPFSRDKYLYVMKYLLEKHRDKNEVWEISRYLRVHGLRNKKLKNDYVRRIVKKIYEVS